MEPPAADPSGLVLLPFHRARRDLAGPLRLRVLLPPFDAIGTGELRVLRVAPLDGMTEIIAGYDGYGRRG